MSPIQAHLVTFKPTERVAELARKVDEALSAEDPMVGESICAMLCVINQLMQHLPVQIQTVINQGTYAQFMNGMFTDGGMPAQYRGAVEPESERKM